MIHWMSRIVYLICHCIIITARKSVPIGRFNDQDASILVERLHGITPSPHLDEQTTNALVAIVHVLTKVLTRNGYKSLC